MSDPELRERRRKRRQRNLIAKDLRQQRFRQRVIDKKIKRDTEISERNYDQYIED